MSKEILTSPIINGTPTGDGLPTVVLKTGDKGGTYTRTSATMADVDADSLRYSVIVPRGWTLTVQAKISGFSSNTSTNLSVQIYDNYNDVTLDNQTLTTSVAANTTLGYTLLGMVAGDGAMHSIGLQFASSVSPNQVNITNSASTFPTMLFTLLPANS